MSKKILFILIILAMTFSKSFTDGTNINCGVVSLWNCAKLLGVSVSLEELNIKFDKKKEVSFLEMYNIAQEIGFEPKAVRVKFNELSQLKSPAIAWAEKNHFITIDKVVNRKVIIIDGLNDPAEMSEEEFNKICDGEILIISKPANGQITPAPSTVFSELMFNFGTIDSDFETSHSFFIKNNSDTRLIIKNVEKNCSCFDVDIEKREIEPGAETKIFIYLYYAEMFGFQKSVATICTDRAGYEKINFEITANIDPRFIVSPSKINAGKIVQNSAKTFDIYVIADKKRNNSVLSVEPGVSGMKWELSDVPVTKSVISKDANEFSRWKIRTTYTSGSKEGRFNDTLKILTNDPKMTHIEIPIEGEIIPEYYSSPENLFFGFQNKNSQLFKSITIKNHKEGNFKIKEVRSGGVNIEAKFNKEKVSDECKIDFLINTGVEETTINSRVEIVLISQKNETCSLSVPVFAIIK